jgi:protein phosphatase
MRYIFSAISHRGKKRQHNEDFYYADFPIFVVADGLGGHRAGEIASKIAVDKFVQQVKEGFVALKNLEEVAILLEKSIVAAGRTVFEESRTKIELEGMGTTISAAVIFNDHLVTAHVGDSRIYLLREGELKRLTTDHTYVQYLLDKGEISKEEAENHPLKNALLQALGGEEKLKVEKGIVSLKPQDKILLCTDGLYNMVAEDNIANTLKSELSPDKKAKILLEAALKAGGLDNITLIIIEVTKE